MSLPYTGSSANESPDQDRDLSRTGYTSLSESGGNAGEELEQEDQHRVEASESASEGNESQREENETDDASESGYRFILCIMSCSKYERSL
jgi:hypothetical protein